MNQINEEVYYEEIKILKDLKKEIEELKNR
jgi:hypothetical protein